MAAGGLSRARAAVLAALAGFVLLQAALAAALSARPRLRDPMYGDKVVRLQKRLADGGPAAASVVVLGTSRTGYGLEAKHLEAALAEELGRPAVAFNFGIPSSGPVLHNLYLKRLLADGVRPDLLLIEVLPPSIIDIGARPMEYHFKAPDRLYRDELRPAERYGYLGWADAKAWRRAAWVPWYGARFALLGRVVPSWNPWSVRPDWSRAADEAGWSPPPAGPMPAEQVRRATEHARWEYDWALRVLVPGGPAVAALRDALATCRAAGVPVALLLMPEGSSFRALYGPGAEGRLRGFLDGLTREFEAPVVNAREWLADEYFFDGHHVVRQGARAFTDRLAREAVPALLRGRGAGDG